MGETEDLRGLTFHGVGLWGAIIMIGLMGLLYAQFSGPLVPDWSGYEELWDNDGGWLANQGRDQLFAWLMRAGGPADAPGHRYGCRGSSPDPCVLEGARVRIAGPRQRHLGRGDGRRGEDGLLGRSWPCGLVFAAADERHGPASPEIRLCLCGR